MEKNSHDPLKEPTQVATPSESALTKESNSSATASEPVQDVRQEAEKQSGHPPQKASPRNPWDKASKIALLIIAVLAVLASAFGICSHHSLMTDVINMSAACSVCRWLACSVLVFLGFKRKDLTTWIVIAMFLGIEIGYSFHDTGIKLGILSKIFLKLVKTIVAPLLFSTLVVGIAGHSNLKEVGRMGLKALIYFEIITTLALIVGLVSINITKAGEGIKQPSQIETIQAAKPQTTSQIILHAFPENIAKSVAENEVLQIVVFSCLFGIAVAQVPLQKRKPIMDVMESLAETMFKYTNLVMYSAPLGVGGAIACTVADMGLGILYNLGYLVATFYITIIVFILVILVPTMLICSINPIRFFKRIAEPATLAFATASSEAALPLAMEKMERFGVPRHIVAFVMPIGYSFNLDGTTLYLSLASIFVAQAAGINLPMETQIAILITLLITSKGVAGVPRASLVILLGSAASFNLPEWPILAIVGVDQLMDMCRTSCNVIGNCLASAVVAKWEGCLGPEQPEPVPDHFV
ncbi:MAG: dicarboxylate/amino acid:cation symporter [Candidatus Bruticola sp.]